MSDWRDALWEFLRDVTTAPHGGRSVDRLATRRALVIGAGPAGLAVAACLRREGVPFRLIDRSGVPGGAYNHIPASVTLLSPARYMHLPGLRLEITGEYVTAPEYRDYLHRYARHHELTVEAGEVRKVERIGDRFRVPLVKGPEEFEAVVVASGMYDHPTWPEVPGLSDSPGLRVLHARDWPGAEAFRGKRLLLVGGATAAVELAEQCAAAGIPVTISARSGLQITPQRFLGRDLHDYAYLVLDKVPSWVAPSYCSRRPTLPGTDRGFRRYRRAGMIRVLGGLERVEGRSFLFRDGSREEFDAVVMATGYQFLTPFLSAEVTRSLAGHPLARSGESVSWPGLFLCGFPCDRTLASEFLRGIALDAPAIAQRVRRRLARRRL